MSFYKIWSSFKTKGDAATYVGDLGRIWYSEADPRLRIGDGVTPGGTLIYNTGAPVYNTTTVTTSSYTLATDDYYVGINYAGVCTVTLPTSAVAGRQITIKDESGNCNVNNIVLVGTIDNDAGGATLAVNNGALAMIYNNGWRII